MNIADKKWVCDIINKRLESLLNTNNTNEFYVVEGLLSSAGFGDDAHFTFTKNDLFLPTTLTRVGVGHFTGAFTSTPISFPLPQLPIYGITNQKDFFIWLSSVDNEVVLYVFDKDKVLVDFDFDFVVNFIKFKN